MAKKNQSGTHFIGNVPKNTLHVLISICNDFYLVIAIICLPMIQKHLNSSIYIFIAVTLLIAIPTSAEDGIITPPQTKLELVEYYEVTDKARLGGLQDEDEYKDKVLEPESPAFRFGNLIPDGFVFDDLDVFYAEAVKAFGEDVFIPPADISRENVQKLGELVESDTEIQDKLIESLISLGYTPEQARSFVSGFASDYQSFRSAVKIDGSNIEGSDGDVLTEDASLINTLDSKLPYGLIPTLMILGGVGVFATRESLMLYLDKLLALIAGVGVKKKDDDDEDAQVTNGLNDKIQAPNGSSNTVQGLDGSENTITKLVTIFKQVPKTITEYVKKLVPVTKTELVEETYTDYETETFLIQDGTELVKIDDVNKAAQLEAELVEAEYQLQNTLSTLDDADFYKSNPAIYNSFLNAINNQIRIRKNAIASIKSQLFVEKPIYIEKTKRVPITKTRLVEKQVETVEEVDVAIEKTVVVNEGFQEERTFQVNNTRNTIASGGIEAQGTRNTVQVPTELYQVRVETFKEVVELVPQIVEVKHEVEEIVYEQRIEQLKYFAPDVVEVEETIIEQRTEEFDREIWENNPLYDQYDYQALLSQKRIKEQQLDSYRQQKSDFLTQRTERLENDITQEEQYLEWATERYTQAFYQFRDTRSRDAERQMNSAASELSTRRNTLERLNKELNTPEYLINTQSLDREIGNAQSQLRALESNIERTKPKLYRGVEYVKQLIVEPKTVVKSVVQMVEKIKEVVVSVPKVVTKTVTKFVEKLIPQTRLVAVSEVKELTRDELIDYASADTEVIPVVKKVQGTRYTEQGKGLNELVSDTVKVPFIEDIIQERQVAVEKKSLVEETYTDMELKTTEETKQYRSRHFKEWDTAKFVSTGEYHRYRNKVYNWEMKMRSRELNKEEAIEYSRDKAALERNKQSYDFYNDESNKWIDQKVEMKAFEEVEKTHQKEVTTIEYENGEVKVPEVFYRDVEIDLGATESFEFEQDVVEFVERDVDRAELLASFGINEQEVQGTRYTVQGNDSADVEQSLPLRTLGIQEQAPNGSRHKEQGSDIVDNLVQQGLQQKTSAPQAEDINSPALEREVYEEIDNYQSKLDAAYAEYQTAMREYDHYEYYGKQEGVYKVDAAKWKKKKVEMTWSAYQHVMENRYVAVNGSEESNTVAVSATPKSVIEILEEQDKKDIFIQNEVAQDGSKLYAGLGGLYNGQKRADGSLLAGSGDVDTTNPRYADYESKLEQLGRLEHSSVELKTKVAKLRKELQPMVEWVALKKASYEAALADVKKAEMLGSYKGLPISYYDRKVRDIEVELNQWEQEKLQLEDIIGGYERTAANNDSAAQALSAEVQRFWDLDSVGSGVSVDEEGSEIIAGNNNTEGVLVASADPGFVGIGTNNPSGLVFGNDLARIFKNIDINLSTENSESASNVLLWKDSFQVGDQVFGKEDWEKSTEMMKNIRNKTREFSEFFGVDEKILALILHGENAAADYRGEDIKTIRQWIENLLSFGDDSEGITNLRNSGRNNLKSQLTEREQNIYNNISNIYEQDLFLTLKNVSLNIDKITMSSNSNNYIASIAVMHNVGHFPDPFQMNKEEWLQVTNPDIVTRSFKDLNNVPYPDAYEAVIAKIDRFVKILEKVDKKEIPLKFLPYPEN
jgi:hypothetical protein